MEVGKHEAIGALTNQKKGGKLPVGRGGKKQPTPKARVKHLKKSRKWNDGNRERGGAWQEKTNAYQKAKTPKGKKQGGKKENGRTSKKNRTIGLI